IAGKLKLEIVKSRDIAASAQFSYDLDKATRAQLDRGLRIQDILNQPSFSPMPAAQQIAILYAVTNGFLDDVPIDKVRAWEDQFQSFVRSAHPEILDTINKDKSLSEQTITALQNAINEFKRTVSL